LSGAVLSSALYPAFQLSGEQDYADKLLSAMAIQFGDILKNGWRIGQA